MDAAANLFGGLVLALILSTVAAAVGSVLGFVLGGFLGALLGATHLDSYAPALGVVAANLPVVVVAVPAISIGESLATAGEVATVIMIVTLLGGIGYLAGKQFANDMQQRLAFAT